MAEKRRKETIDIGKGMAWTTGQGTRDATTEGTADNTSLIFFFVLYFLFVQKLPRWKEINPSNL